ncbi:MAG: DUF192 domain-containing protein [Nanoarchaeota archaeon]
MIINKTRKTIVSSHERLGQSFLSQSLGLMFRPRENLLMVFTKERRVSLQMWFVFYPITVLVVNKDKVVVEIKENFWPFTFWTSREKGKYVLELGSGQGKGKAMVGKVEVGDRLEIKLKGPELSKILLSSSLWRGV